MNCKEKLLRFSGVKDGLKIDTFADLPQCLLRTECSARSGIRESELVSLKGLQGLSFFSVNTEYAPYRESSKQAPMLVYTECVARSAIGVYECVDFVF